MVGFFDRTGVPYYVAAIPRRDWGIIGSEYGNSIFEHTTVLWLSTLRNRLPADSWLSKNFPSAPIRLAAILEASDRSA